MKNTKLMNHLLERAKSMGWEVETTDSGTREELIAFVKPSPLGIPFALYLKPQDMATPESLVRFIRTSALEFNLHTYMTELSTWTGFDEQQTVGAHIDDCFTVQQSISTLAKELQAVYDIYLVESAPSPAFTLKDVTGIKLRLCYDHENSWTVITILGPNESVESRYRIEDHDFIHLLKYHLLESDTTKEQSCL